MYTLTSTHTPAHITHTLALPCDFVVAFVMNRDETAAATTLETHTHTHMYTYILCVVNRCMALTHCISSYLHIMYACIPYCINYHRPYHPTRKCS